MAGNKDGQPIEKKGGMSVPVSVGTPAQAPKKPNDSSTSAIPSSKEKT